jgi:hypothetical protein
MTRPLALARQSFVAAIQRDTPGTDLPRLVAVLDSLLAWSAARRKRVAFRADGRTDVISFGRAGSTAAVWSAQVTMGEGPKLELFTPPNAAGAETRAAVMAALNAHSRAVLLDGDRLRISFGALKNDAGREAVFTVMEQLLSAGSTRKLSA